MTEAYAVLRQRAREQWDAWVNDGRPRIFVQTNSDSLASGAKQVREAVTAALKKHKIDAAVTAVGSSGMTFADVMVDIIKPGKPRVTYGYVTPETAAQLITDVLVDNNPRADAALGVHADSAVDGIPPLREHPFQKLQYPIIMKNFGHVEPGNLMHYIAQDGYKALDKALGMEREAVRKEVELAALRGRGGALFPAATKWGFMMNAPHPKILAVNGEEGDPGAFSDKAIAENDPHILLEGILIGSYTMGIDKTYIHIRAEYQVAVDNLRRALKELEEAGLVGHSILGTGFSTEIEIEATGHAYICGEETSLMDSVEGKRGTPRPRPPFPAAYGIFGRPTNINNVKTMSYVPQLILNGGERFKKVGTAAATGTMFLSLCGTFKRRGFAEVPLGTPLKAVVDDMCGGSSSDSPIKGLQTGGPLGGATSWEAAKGLNLEFAPMDSLGAPVGSGGIMAIDGHVCAVDLTLNLMEFNAAESCGKCFPCRKGTGHVVAKLRNIAAGHGSLGDLDEMVAMGDTMRNGSLCGLGQLAPRIINAMLRHFRSEFEAHITNHVCKQGVCPLTETMPIAVS